MPESFSRQLADLNNIDHFLKKVLRFNYEEETPKVNYKIQTSETGLADFKFRDSTLNSTNHRDRLYKEDDKRLGLRKQIVDELFELSRIDDDDSIELTIGGCLPLSGVKSEKKAFIVIGLPASGKSTICNIICEKYGAILLDSDYAKRKLPEYEPTPWGATIVHQEASAIVFGDEKAELQGVESVYEKSLYNNYNIVIPTIGHDPLELIKLAQSLNRLDYEVHLTLVSLKRQHATIRAIKRFHLTNRYVPLGLIFDSYANDPIMSYYIIKNKSQELFKSYGAISTDVNPGENPKCIDYFGDNPSCEYEKFLTLLF